jgi:RNA polymerase sigma factor (sigma-70 family)
MQTWAYNFFLRKNFAAGGQTMEIAEECATEAAISLLNTHFPYDTDFAPWAHIIVQNACRKFIHRSLKKSAVPDDKKVELDDERVDADALLLAEPIPTDLDGDLVAALSQLSEARRTVIQYLYFDGLNPEETAQKMGKSVSAIYTLQFHALRDLRKIMNAIRDNLNE